MATTTAAITLTSADLLTDALSLSATNTLTKAGSTVDLDQTTGMARAYLTSTTPIDIFPAIVEDGTDLRAFNGKSSWVYICNKSEDETEYITVKICENVIGKLYAQDFLWMPWSQSADVTNAANHHGDITIAPSVATGMYVEFTCINEGTEYHTENLAIA
tara:strand:+ start:407 stop:886 length:480 start_codon:yes stop_codon:yes gene_type:complete